MSTRLSPRESGKFIAEHSQDVKVSQDGARQVAEKLYDILQKDEFSIKNWKEHPLHPKEMNDAAVDWIFVVDTLNFSFWSETNDKRCLIRYKDKNYSGYWCMCAAINRALEEGIPITSPSYYSKVTREELAHIFRSETDTGIPLLDKRVQHLHEAGTVLMEKFGGSFVNCLSKCEQSATKLIDLITSNFSSFRDVATFADQNVSLLKRAQIVVADTWACFEGKGHGLFTDIDCITMFADYRVPQSLIYFGVMSYSEALMQRLKDSTLFTPGERLEVEIRGCSIWAVELILEELKKILQKDPQRKDLLLNAIIVDFYMWDYAKEHRADMEHIPIHKIRSIYY